MDPWTRSRLRRVGGFVAGDLLVRTITLPPAWVSDPWPPFDRLRAWRQRWRAEDCAVGMHGSPITRTVVVVIVLLLMGIPLMRMTGKTAAGQGTGVRQVAPEQRSISTVHLGVTFVPRAARFEVDYLGKTIWKSDVMSESATMEVPMIVPKEGVDLEYKVEWPAGTTGQTAARLSVAVGNAEATEKTLWGTGNVDDVLTFP